MKEVCYVQWSAKIHYVVAGLLFATAIVSIWYNGGENFTKKWESVKERLDGGKRKDGSEPVEKKFDVGKYVSAVKVLAFGRYFGGALVACGVAYAIIVFWDGGKELLGRWLVIPELLGFVGFGIYWFAFTWSISQANEAAKAVEQEREKLREKAEEEKKAAEEGLGKAAEEAPKVITLVHRVMPSRMIP